MHKLGAKNKKSYYHVKLKLVLQKYTKVITTLGVRGANYCNTLKIEVAN
jgi:hypothetical protein